MRRYTSLEEMLQEGWASSSSVYRAAKTIFTQERSPSHILIGRKDPALKEEVQPEEEDSQEGEVRSLKSARTSESVITALNAIIEENDQFYGIISPLKNDQDILDIADFAEVREKLYHVSLSDPLLFSPQDTSSVAYQLKQKKYNQTIISYYSLAGGASDPFIEGGVLAEGFSETLGSINWANISLKGIEPNYLSDGKILALKEKNINFYHPIYNIQRWEYGKCIGGEWVDIVTGKYLLMNEIEEGMSDLIKKQYTKVSYSVASFKNIENTLSNILNSFTEKGKDLLTEYIIHMPTPQEISASEKEKRHLTITFSATLAGAINFLTISGSVGYDGVLTFNQGA